MATLRAGVESARRAASGPIVVSTGAAFATRWLVTQLARLSAETGELDLTIRVEDRMSDLVTDGADVALRFGAGPWPGTESVPSLRSDSWLSPQRESIALLSVAEGRITAVTFSASGR